MGYLEEVKKRIEDIQLEVIESYKVFMDEIIVPDLARQNKTSLSMVYKTTLVEDNINPDDFCSWLKEEGFTVIISQGSDQFTISY